MTQSYNTELARLIDHTLLKPTATTEQIKNLCQEGRDYQFAAVCVHPIHVILASEQLRDSEVAACTVVGFPLGANLSTVKLFETQQALRDGATEIDMVINIGALKEKAVDIVQADIALIARTCHQAGAICKVIIETALLTEEEKVLACELVHQAEADFVKTSTGFSTGGATVEDVALMRRTVGPEMGVKAAGGMRTAADAQAMIAAGATRLGTSSGVKIVTEEIT